MSRALSVMSRVVRPRAEPAAAKAAAGCGRRRPAQVVASTGIELPLLENGRAAFRRIPARSLDEIADHWRGDGAAGGLGGDGADPPRGCRP
jgi:hypothetical protein